MIKRNEISNPLRSILSKKNLSKLISVAFFLTWKCDCRVILTASFYYQIPIEETSLQIFFFFQSNFFDEYRIEGKDETNNIYLELVPENLARAMKSAGSAQAVKIKLTKKHTPCLTFEVTLVSAKYCHKTPS